MAAEDKVSNVRDHVKSVLDVINAEKEKQLNEAVSSRLRKKIMQTYYFIVRVV